MHTPEQAQALWCPMVRIARDESITIEKAVIGDIVNVTEQRHIVGGCERWIFANWEHFPESVRKLIQRDLEEEFARDDEARERGAAHKPLGHDCYRAAWERVRTLWKEKT